MLATLEMIREVYGGAEGYVKDKCGLSDDDIARVRQSMVHMAPLWPDGTPCPDVESKRPSPLRSQACLVQHRTMHFEISKLVTHQPIHETNLKNVS